MQLCKAFGTPFFGMADLLLNLLVFLLEGKSKNLNVQTPHRTLADVERNRLDSYTFGSQN